MVRNPYCNAARLPEPRPSRQSLDPAKIHIGGDVQRTSIVSPRDICGGLTRLPPAQSLFVRSKDMDSPGASRKKISLRVNLHSVRQSLILPYHRSHVRKDASWTDRPLGLHRIRHPDRLLGIGLGDV